MSFVFLCILLSCNITDKDADHTHSIVTNLDVHDYDGFVVASKNVCKYCINRIINQIDSSTTTDNDVSVVIVGFTDKQADNMESVHHGKVDITALSNVSNEDLSNDQIIGLRKSNASPQTWRVYTGDKSLSHTEEPLHIARFSTGKYDPPEYLVDEINIK